MSDEQTWARDMLAPIPDEPSGFRWDLAVHELRRVAAVLDGMPDWHPGAAMARETEANRMLMSDLDDEQRAAHRLLVEAGVFDA